MRPDNTSTRTRTSLRRALPALQWPSGSYIRPQWPTGVFWPRLPLVCTVLDPTTPKFGASSLRCGRFCKWHACDAEALRCPWPCAFSHRERPWRPCEISPIWAKIGRQLARCGRVLMPATGNRPEHAPASIFRALFQVLSCAPSGGEQFDEQPPSIAPSTMEAHICANFAVEPWTQRQPPHRSVAASPALPRTNNFWQDRPKNQ